MVSTAAASSSVPAASLVAERVGRYRLLDRLGSGGMATVFLARSEGLGGFERDVAIKLLHEHLRENPEMAAQLVNEARISAKIRHPNVVPVHDVVEDASGIFLVMEYVEGDTLSGLQRAARAAGEPMPLSIALRILTDALAGLHGAHELRDDDGERLEIVHRDFSPQNILVGTDGIARLTDFGIAKTANRGGHTRPGFIKGKIGYMSPEQARGKPVDRRCDVWAAGVIAWELIAGRPLRGGDDEMATLLEVVSAVPPDVRTVVPDVSPALADAVASALTPDLDRRCLSADAFRRRLIEAARAEVALADRVDVAAYVKRIGRTVNSGIGLVDNRPGADSSSRRQDPGGGFATSESARLFHRAGRGQSITATLPSMARPAFVVPPVVSSLPVSRHSRRRWWPMIPVALVALSIGGSLFVRSSSPAPSSGGSVLLAAAISPPVPQAKVQPPTIAALVDSETATPAVTQPRAAHVVRIQGKRDLVRAGRSRLRATASLRTDRHPRVEPNRAAPSAAAKGPPPLAGNPYAAPR